VHEGEPAPETAHRFVRPVVILIFVGLLAGGGVTYLSFRGEHAKNPLPVEPVSETRREPATSLPVTPKPATPIGPTTTAGPLTVSDFGVGRRIANLRLEGEDDRFAPGARVCFSTRVLGGQRGDLIRHVWLYEGRVEQSIPLRLGGPDWRTHSNKTLGHAGSWTAEARDDRGHVLARATFTCAPVAP
jgi:hypothetical protein